MHTPNSASRLSAGLLYAAIAVGAAACDRGQDPLSPAGAEGTLSAAPTQEHFYYYQGQPVYLDADPTRLVVVSSSPSSRRHLDEALAGAGMRVQAMERLSQVRDHFVVRVSGGSTRGAAAAALARLRADQRFRFSSPVFRTRASGDEIVLVDELLVQFKPGVGRAQVDSLNAAFGTTLVALPQPDSARGWHVLRYNAGSDPLATAARYDRHPLVEWANPDKIAPVQSFVIPQEPLFPQQWYLYNPTVTHNGVPVDINVVPAWDLTLGAGARVAIIDDGVEYSHPEFAYREARYYDSFQGAYCSDGIYSSAASPCADDRHGTAVAGVLLAPHNYQGVAGTAPNVYMMFARIIKNRAGNTEGAIAGTINWAWKTATADVISNSWGYGSPSNAITSAINAATTQGRGGKGTVVVFAAGNNSTRSLNGYVAPVAYPASLSSVIAVAAIGPSGTVASYSSGGSQIDIAAPSSGSVGSSLCGVGDVVTTDLLGARGCINGPGPSDDYTERFGGTSAAAPMVAGVAALLLSREPSLTATQVRARLMAGADPWGAANDVGAGKLNAYRTLVP